MRQFIVLILLSLVVLSLQQSSKPSATRSSSAREAPQTLAGSGGAGGGSRSLACERVQNKRSSKDSYVSAQVWCQYRDDLLTGGGCNNDNNANLVSSYPNYPSNDYPSWSYKAANPNRSSSLSVTAYAVCCYYY